MKRKIPLTQEQREWRDKFIKEVYEKTNLSLEDIGRIFGISKQLVNIIIKKK
jgi:hypothetical protein